jgi:zinc protease
MNPTPNVPRRQQYFSVWVRPVVPDTAHFALRDALFEVDRLASRGLTQEEFELARDFLINYSKLWGQTLPNRLAWHMDSRYYGMPYYIDEIDKRLEKLTVDEVNATVKKYIQTDDFHAVLVTNNAEEVKAYLEKDQPSPMKYNTPPEQQVLDADVTIQNIEVEPTQISIVPVAKMFQE